MLILHTPGGGGDVGVVPGGGGLAAVPGGGGDAGVAPGGGGLAGVRGGGDGPTLGQQQAPESATTHALIPPLMESPVQVLRSKSSGGAAVDPAGHCPADGHRGWSIHWLQLSS